MMIRVFQDTLIGSTWTGVGVGNFAPDIAQQLIALGVAEPYEAKVVQPTELKLEKKTLSSASQQGQASPKQTARKRRSRKPES